jgi:hypothetical protein
MTIKQQYRWATIRPDGRAFGIYWTRAEAKSNISLDAYMLGPAQHKKEPILTVRKVRLVLV